MNAIKINHLRLHTNETHAVYARKKLATFAFRSTNAKKKSVNFQFFFYMKYWVLALSIVLPPKLARDIEKKNVQTTINRRRRWNELLVALWRNHYQMQIRLLNRDSHKNILARNEYLWALYTVLMLFNSRQQAHFFSLSLLKLTFSFLFCFLHLMLCVYSTQMNFSPAAQNKRRTNREKNTFVFK